MPLKFLESAGNKIIFQEVREVTGGGLYYIAPWEAECDQGRKFAWKGWWRDYEVHDSLEKREGWQLNKDSKFEYRIIVIHGKVV